MVSCGLKGVVGCMPTTGHTQKLWGGLASNAHDAGASGHHHRDLVMAWQLDLLARQAWGHARLVFGCMLRVCKCTGLGKKQKSEKKKNKKTNSRLTGLNPHKNMDLYRPCVSCVCVASVRACREACEGGMAMVAKRGQWERLW